MSPKTIRKQLHEIIDQYPEEELEELLELIRGPEKQGSVLDDPEVLAEMNRRVEAYRNGTERTFTAEESAEQINKLFKRFEK